MHPVEIQRSYVPSLTGDGEPLLPRFIRIRKRLFRVILCTYDRVHRTPARFEGMMICKVVFTQLVRAAASESLWLSWIRPLDMRKTRITLAYKHKSIWFNYMKAGSQKTE